MVAFAPHRGTAQTLPAPVLEPFDGPWHSQTYTLRGEVARARFLSIVRILRNGVVIDSTSASIDSLFSVNVPVLVGTNLLTAVFVDSVDTLLITSPPSNTVRVVFDTSAGFFIKIPMAAGSSFDLNAVNTATRAQIRVFDMLGDLVVEFESNEARTFYSFPWDGLNASGERVRRGPLIAVGRIDYPGGEQEIVRRPFLFDPEASP